MQTDQEVIDKLVQTVVNAVNPLKIILFGSAAKDDRNNDSDVDILVVMPDGTHRRRTDQELHFKMQGFPLPVDILVATPADLEKHKDNIGLIYKTVLKEGRDIYVS
ncbi:MAG: nucleotidyltransferase domain-containing protein [Candidatus Omnitrophota bacterium]